MHVDDFIDRFTPIHEFASDEERDAERYARFVLMLLRLPAALRLDFDTFIPDLFCTYRGMRYLVVFASRMGWIGLTPNFTSDKYEECCEPDACSDWSATP